MRIRINTGPDAGVEHSFDAFPIILGRGRDVHVSLSDVSVSRRHAHITKNETEYIIEDLGSGAGTFVSGARITRQTLTQGTVVALGEASVTVQWDATVTGKTVALPNPLFKASDQTRVVKRPGHSETVPVDYAEKSGPQENGATAKRPALSQNLYDAKENTDTLKAPVLPLPRVPKRHLHKLRASDRARYRRKHPGLFGKFGLYWLESSTGRRLAIVCSFFLFAGLSSLGAFVAYQQSEQKIVRIEPKELGPRPVEESFGAGPGVDFTILERKEFVYTYATPNKFIALLQFQSVGISANEVDIFLNGERVGSAPPDSGELRGISEVVLPSRLLKSSAANVIGFQQVKRTPGDESWKISNIRVEAALLPDLPVPEILSQAQESFKNATGLFERRALGNENAYRAWTLYKSAWLFLEELPPPRPELHQQAYDEMKRTQEELDRMCNELLLRARSLASRNQIEEAREVLSTTVKEHFPNYDQSCPKKAAIERSSLGL